MCTLERDLTPPSSGRSKGRFAPFGPPLMSNVRSLEHRTVVGASLLFVPGIERLHRLVVSASKSRRLNAQSPRPRKRATHELLSGPPLSLGGRLTAAGCGAKAKHALPQTCVGSVKLLHKNEVQVASAQPAWSCHRHRSASTHRQSLHWRRASPAGPICQALWQNSHCSGPARGPAAYRSAKVSAKGASAGEYARAK